MDCAIEFKSSLAISNQLYKIEHQHRLEQESIKIVTQNCNHHPNKNLIRPLNKCFTSKKLWEEYVIGKYYRYFGLSDAIYVRNQNEIYGNNNICHNNTEANKYNDVSIDIALE